MHVVGPQPEPGSQDAVHTIDVWFSPTKHRYVVQRLDEAGDPMGHGHLCRTRHEAEACVAEWLRRHPETHLASAREHYVASRRKTTD